jgi:glycerol-3-phosphate dehydrogenase
MNRKQMVETLDSMPGKVWDMLIIGGGATGLGAGLDAASRGYRTILLEQSDFSQGTSSRSTKLVHGGVRYLAQGDISLVLEALHERGLMRQNAPHLVKNQSFIIPNYDWWDGPFYTIGMKVYDMMAGKLGLGPSEHISKQETLKSIPNLSEDGLIGGVIYYDGQFDDSRFAINLAQTMSENDGVPINYFKVIRLTKTENGIIDGVQAKDMLSGKVYEIKARVVINATGVFADSILQMDEPGTKNTIVPSQGIHIVLDKSFLLGDSAIMIPKTSDGRVLFAVPWHGKVVLGTTDTPVREAVLEPRALDEEIDFILNTAARYLKKTPKRHDVLSIFAGLRPLAAPDDGSSETKEISRSHKLTVSLSGLVTITGGKWTTYRKMAEDTIDKAAMVAGLDERKCLTRNMPLHGYVAKADFNDHMHIYGSERTYQQALLKEKPEMGEKLHPDLPYTALEVVWAVRYEMAMTLEDVLSRRVRALFLNARAAIEMAPKVARLMALESSWDHSHEKQQIDEFVALANGYLLK